MRVLILNIFSRNALAVVNSIDRSITLYGADIEYERCRWYCPDFGLHSSRICKIVRHADPVKNMEKFIQDLVNFCNCYEIDAVIPAGDQIVRYVSKAKLKINERTNAIILTEDYEKLLRISDKWLTTQICAQQNVPCPKSTLLDLAGNWKSEIINFKWPIVAKPRTSHASKGVVFFDNRQDLVDWITAQQSLVLIQNNQPVYMLQECIYGSLHDVALVAYKGETMAAFSQRRISGLYDFGGGGIVTITTDEPKIIEYAKHIVAALEWNGVCEFDFILSPTGEFYLLECNPRLWGTTQLSTEAGINIVQLLVDIFVAGKQPEPIKDYHKGLLYRWWYPEIAYHLIQSPRTPKQFVKRWRKIIGHYEANEIRSNINFGNLRHFAGMTLNAICK